MKGIKMVGTREAAEMALMEALEFGYGSEHYIDSGGNRKALLIDGVIYKVMHSPIYGSNDSELDWSQRLAEIIIPDAIPVKFLPVTQYAFEIDGTRHTVNAMPFIDGVPIGYDENSMPTHVRRYLEETVGLTDMYGDNVLYADGTFHVVDAEM
jgi:hypothetical protein